mmetsp:Transcript_52594/g.170936  ORF Transcript_52594/g.170936 Transcript_52594/m.170936 type:complete len:90 (-) Transcript_52594:89-358(-)
MWTQWGTLVSLRIVAAALLVQALGLRISICCQCFAEPLVVCFVACLKLCKGRVFLCGRCEENLLEVEQLESLTASLLVLAVGLRISICC